MADEIIQVVTTTADKQDAETLSQALLTKRLAACVQITGPIESSYWWNGRIETGTEWTCTVKTLRSLYSEVEQTLLDLHPYDQPEILAVAVSDVSQGYAQWLREQVQPEFPPEVATDSTAASPSTEQAAVPPSADVTPAQAAEMIPAAGLAAAAQSNVPQAMPFAAGNVEAPGAISEQLALAPESVPETPAAASNATSGEGKPAKRAPKKKTPKPSA